MLSILVPIFNYPALNLITKLSEQSVKEGITFEIICIDDASTQYLQENKEISEILGVKFEQLETNIGRSKLRNLLAERALYPNLLFIDNDMEVISSTFINSYHQHINDYEIVYGGICYSKHLTDYNKVLRWKYGIKRETLSVEKRQEFPYFSLKFCNILIKKEIFNELKFNVAIIGYGHEDTLFCLGLERLKASVKHIDNPLMHAGLEDATVFLKKTEIACKNLYFIASNFLKPYELEHIRLIYFYNRLNKMGILPILEKCYEYMERRILENLNSKNPNLLLLDYYKLIAYSKSNQATRS